MTVELGHYFTAVVDGGAPIILSEEALDNVIAPLKKYKPNKIEAVKILRRKTGSTLKDSLAVIDEMLDRVKKAREMNDILKALQALGSLAVSPDGEVKPASGEAGNETPTPSPIKEK
jgi:ribosomal protein L7/L12